MNIFVAVLFVLTNFQMVPEENKCNFEKLIQGMELHLVTKKDSRGFYYVIQDKKYKGRFIPVKMKNCYVSGLTTDSNLVLATFNKFIISKATASGIGMTSFDWVPVFVVLYLPETLPQELKERIRSDPGPISFDGSLEFSTHSSMAIFAPEASPRSVGSIGYLYIGVTPKVINGHRVPRR